MYLIGEKLFYSFDEPNIGGFYLFSFLVLSLLPDPPLPINFISCASSLAVGSVFYYAKLLTTFSDIIFGFLEGTVTI
jgi:hypothetical protein